MTRLLLILTVVFLASCRCSTDYKAIENDQGDKKDTTINASARMWQGQYEYLGIDIKIKRTDSLFVKNIIVKPFRKDGRFYPWFADFVMNSYYMGNEQSLGNRDSEGVYWEDYFADKFQDFPKENRKTNKNESFVTYTACYNSEKSIDFEDFSADIQVQLIDRQGKEIRLEQHFDFHGERNCRLSPH